MAHMARAGRAARACDLGVLMEPLNHSHDGIRRLAEAQHGVVTRQQLLALGLGAEAIKIRRRTGRLVPMYRGVYALGHRALRPQAWWLAAVFACGPGAVLSHRSAARLWGLRPWSGRVEVTAARDRDPAPGGVAVHRSRAMAAWEVTREDGIPVTTVARTLLDLAGVVPVHHLRRAVQRANELELFHLLDVDRVLEAHPRRPGRRALIALLADARRHGLERTRSDPEAAMLQLCLDHDLPRPQVNRFAGGREMDFRWPEQRLVVEVDGWTWHRTREAFAADRARDRQLLREGFRVARFPAMEVLDAPAMVAAELRALLAT
ncbi:MAG TPA: type IV toxin-antitoxin system AbiEi family antitoxin domain-containing protein [Baekduia sp.]|nr:type IV toxin-antitoxin system AbiEi family antitoxin domain-containing protein [Baekduia sp.]